MSNFVVIQSARKVTAILFIMQLFASYFAYQSCGSYLNSSQWTYFCMFRKSPDILIILQGFVYSMVGVNCTKGSNRTDVCLPTQIEPTTKTVWFWLTKTLKTVNSDTHCVTSSTAHLNLGNKIAMLLNRSVKTVSRNVARKLPEIRHLSSIVKNEERVWKIHYNITKLNQFLYTFINSMR
jgi:hypothetical protein